MFERFFHSLDVEMLYITKYLFLFIADGSRINSPDSDLKIFFSIHKVRTL